MFNFDIYILFVFFVIWYFYFVFVMIYEFYLLYIVKCFVF